MNWLLRRTGTARIGISMSNFSQPELCPFSSVLRGNRMIPVLPRKPQPFKNQQQSMTNEISSTTTERGAGARWSNRGRPEGRDERDRASQIERIFTNGEPLRRRICLQVLFVFISESGSSVQRLDLRAERAHLLSQWTKISESMKTRPQP